MEAHLTMHKLLKNKRSKTQGIHVHNPPSCPPRPANARRCPGLQREGISLLHKHQLSYSSSGTSISQPIETANEETPAAGPIILHLNKAKLS